MNDQTVDSYTRWEDFRVMLYETGVIVTDLIRGIIIQTNQSRILISFPHGFVLYNKTKIT